jgi:hypothetical protein
MTAKDDLHLLERCGAIRTHGALAKGEYPGGYYPAYVRDAADEVGIGTLCATVVNACDAEWAHRLLCLCDVDSVDSLRLLDIIEDHGSAGDWWGVLFTHGPRMHPGRFERFAFRLIKSGNCSLIECAAQYVTGFRSQLPPRA